MRKSILALPLLLVGALSAAAIDAPASVPMEPDHCIGLLWSDGGSLNLVAMLDPTTRQFLDKLYFIANGEECSDGILHFDGYCPGSLKPDIYYVALHHRDIDRPLDVMWVVVNSPVTQTEFLTWASSNTNTSWTVSLPRPYASIAVTNGVATDPEPPGPDGRPGVWDAPHRIDPKSYLHHSAVWEMRTTLSGVHGNQATYDATGNLIRTTIAAGTADHFGPYGEDGKAKWSTRHRNEDVWPYIQALQLDGNPVRIPRFVGVPSRITRPCLVQGFHITTYLMLRPTILP